MQIDLNCDMGESFGTYELGYDAQAMPFVTSINVACGFHASDPDNMAKTVALAKQHGVAVGAHPGYPDLVGFGRRSMALTAEEVKNTVIYQIGALDSFCRAAGIKLQHVKVHGALYNNAEKDLTIATAIAEAIKAVDPTLYMLCLANSQMGVAARNAGLPYVEEAFADRAYTKQGPLAPRKLAGAVIHEPAEVAARVLEMVQTGSVQSIDGETVPISAQTICVHGDTPGAVEMIRLIRSKLEQAGVVLRPFGKA